MSSDFSETLDLDLRDLAPVERGLLPDVKLSGDFSLLPKDKSINYSILVSEGNSTMWRASALFLTRILHSDS